jgi:hypothetical protein
MKPRWNIYNFISSRYNRMQIAYSASTNFFPRAREQHAIIR